MIARRYVVAGCRPWLRAIFEEQIGSLPGEWSYVSDHAELTTDLLSAKDPRYVFFLHWSWKVPAEITNAFECVNFHMTDVPYGRGGSPLQNLIERGHESTVVTALRMVSEVDAGPVYAKRTMSLHGCAEEIYVRAAQLSARMIADIVAAEPSPRPQVGEVVEFKRRSPLDSELRDPTSLEAIYDLVRMLDADGYPHAFVRCGDFRFEFTHAVRYSDSVQAHVTVTRDPQGRT